MVTVLGNGYGDKSSNTGRTQFAFSHGANTLRKGMNPIILPSAMGK